MAGDKMIVNSPLVSVCMVTYNHEKWIGQAIEGVLMQKTSFTVELVIGEDCSTDKTAETLRLYQVKYPHRIKIVFNEVNKGLAKNFSQLLNKCSGKYIAICEGDDFWTDPDKLAKQVKFLETSDGYVICSHNCNRFYEADNSVSTNTRHNNNFSYNQRQHLANWNTQPLTCLFRNIFKDYSFFDRNNMFCDVIIFYELLKFGSGYFMNDNMATFRVHQHALSSGLSEWQWQRNHVLMYDHLFKYNPEDKLLQKISANHCLIMYVNSLKKSTISTNEFKPLPEYYKRTPVIANKVFTSLVRLPYYFLKYSLINKK